MQMIKLQKGFSLLENVMCVGLVSGILPIVMLALGSGTQSWKQEQDWRVSREIAEDVWPRLGGGDEIFYYSDALQLLETATGAEYEVRVECQEAGYAPEYVVRVEFPVGRPPEQRVSYEFQRLVRVR